MVLDSTRQGLVSDRRTQVFCLTDPSLGSGLRMIETRNPFKIFRSRRRTHRVPQLLIYVGDGVSRRYVQFTLCLLHGPCLELCSNDNNNN